MKTTASRSGRGWKVFLGVVCLLVVVMLIGSSPIFPWTPFNCWHEDVDIRTGKTRYTRYLFFCRVKTEIRDSAISLALLSGERDDVAPDWRRVYTFSPGMRNSPHYIFHGALNQVRSLEMIWTDLRPTTEQKQKMAQDVLALWQYEDGDHLANLYLQALWHVYQMSENEWRAFFEKLETLKICEQRKIGETTEFTARYPDGTLLERHQVRITESGEHVPHGQYVRWYRDKNSGEEITFENGKPVNDWHSITNYPE